MEALIEGLPDAVALQCLARVPLSCHPNMRAVNRAWRSLLYSEEFYKLRDEIGSREDWLYVSAYEPDKIWQAFNPSPEQWFTLPPLPTSVNHLSNFGTVSLEGKLYVIGGRSDDVDPVTGERGDVLATDEVWVFDPITRLWSAKSSMLQARSQFACCVMKDRIVVAGGFTANRQSTVTSEMYDPVEDKWKRIADLCKTANAACSGVFLEGNVYVIQKEIPLAQVYEATENKWVSVDCTLSQGLTGVVNGDMCVTLNDIVSTSADFCKTIFSWPSCYRRLGFGFAHLGGDLYVVGGVTLPRSNEVDLEPLSEVWIQKADGKQWQKGVNMTLCKGTILACCVVRL